MNKYLKFLTFSITILGGGTTLNSSICYCTETIANDLRSQYMIRPALLFYESYNYDLISPKKYPNYKKPKYDIAQILEYCEEEKAYFLNKLIMDFIITCNKIVYPLLYGSQMEYDEKSSDKPAEDFSDDWINISFNLQGYIFNAIEASSARLFQSELSGKDIMISKDFLQEIDTTITDVNFKVFDNPNYLNEDVNLVQLFKYLGNRVLQLSSNAFNKIYYKIEQSRNKNIIDKRAYLYKEIFGNIIVPFYKNLKTLNNILYEINKYIVTCENYDNKKLNKQLKSTADYINDVLKYSKMEKYHKNYSQITDEEGPVQNQIICEAKYITNPEDEI